MNDRRDQIDSLRSATLALHRLLHEDDHELAGGVASILGELDAADELGCEKALRNVRSLYRSMTGGAGSLLDAFITHPDEQVQARLNEELSFARQRLSELLRQSQETGERR